MANSLFIKADEVAELLGVSRAEAYRIIKRLNDQLSSRGFIVVNGRVNLLQHPFETLSEITQIWR